MVVYAKWDVYHSGDTVLYPGLVDRLRTFRITAALLPINGRSRDVAGNLTAVEAACFGKWIDTRMLRRALEQRFASQADKFLISISTSICPFICPSKP